MATIFNNQDEDSVSDRSGVSAPGPLQTVGTTAPAGAMVTPDKKPQGSGRFTNLQKYIQANQGAGQQIAGQVGKGVKEELGKEHREAGEYYKNLGTAISGANKVAKEGHKYQQTLDQIGQNIKGAGYKKDGGTVDAQRGADLGISQITGDQDKFRQFQDIQAGRGIDERLLGLRQQQAARESGQYLDAARGAEESLGSESGRFQLLRKTFGGAARPGYSTGQQRLDQALLSQSGLGDLRKQVGGDVRSATEQNRLSTAAAGDVGRLASQEQGLMRDINTSAAANESSYMDMLNSYVDPIQAARDAQWTSLDDAAKSYIRPGEGQVGSMALRPGFNAEQMANLGVDRGQGVYNVFDSVTGAGDIAKKGTTARSAQDIASQSDVDRYSALAQMMGANPAANISQAGDLGAAYGKRGDEFDLQNRMSAAQRGFDKTLGETDFNRSGTASYWLNDLGAAFGSRSGTRWNSEASARGLFDRGKDAISGNYGGGRSGAARRGHLDNAREQTWKDFQQFMGDQNYSQTLGGRRGSSVQDQTIKDNPYMATMPIKLGAAPIYTPRTSNIKKGK